MKTNLVSLSTLLLLCAAVATAQPLCVPLAQGVPGTLYNRAPNWWNDADFDPPLYNTNIDAPSWRGALALGYPLGTATTEEVHFRALHRTDDGKEQIYLSWYGKVVPDLTTLNVNKLIVGFSSAAGNPAFAFTITPNVTSPKTATQDYTLLMSVNTGSGWGPYVGPLPTWIKGVADPANDGTGRIWVINAPNNQWAVHMRVPLSTIATPSDISDGLPFDPLSFRMWYEFRVGAAAMPSGFIPYKFPRTIPDVDPITDEPPSIGSWATMHLNSSATIPDPGCSMNGVGITSADIGTQNADGTPNADRHAISLLQPNTLFAQPFNHSVTTTANDVRARFRIANWGSTAGWEDVPDPNTNLWVDVDGPGGVPLGGVDISPNSSANIQLTYDISGPTSLCERCKYQSYYNAPANTANCNANCGAAGTNNTKLDHQCMLVELTGPGVDFLNDSVYTNMNFVNASTFSEAAEINLAELSGNLARDVYFYIESYNMPERTPGRGGSQPVPASASAEPVDPFKPVWSCHPAFDVNRPKDERRKELQLLLHSGQLTHQDIAHNMPTYIVHTYYDSGIRNTAGGSPRPVLRPMQPFGYFVMHDGQPAGWVTDLKGAQRIAPNWYRITTPESGVVRIYPTIQSVDRPSPPASSSLRVFLDLGPNFPQGSFGDFADGQLSINAGLERFVAANTSLEAILGYHAFDSDFGSNPRIWQLSANVKQYFGEGRLRYFVNGGAGAYRFDPGSTTRAGANVGTGVLYDLPSVWDVEGVYNFHVINTSDSRTRFSTVQIGIRRSL